MSNANEQQHFSCTSLYRKWIVPRKFRWLDSGSLKQKWNTIKSQENIALKVFRVFNYIPKTEWLGLMTVTSQRPGTFPIVVCSGYVFRINGWFTGAALVSVNAVGHGKTNNRQRQRLGSGILCVKLVMDFYVHNMKGSNKNSRSHKLSFLKSIR